MPSTALPLGLAVAVLAGSANPQVARPRTVTFNRDIAPLVFRSCATCHRPGDAAPFSLVTYDEVRQHARQIATVTESRYMPPWKPEPGYGDFGGVRRLRDEEVDLFRQWIDGGLLRGDPNDLPPAPRWPTGWQLGEPDMVLTMPTPYLLKGDGPDQLRSFVIPIPVTATRYVKGVEFHPGNSRAVHHANIKIDRTRLSRRFDDEDPDPGYDGGGSREARFPDGHFLGWTPGQLPHLTPEGSGWRLDPDSDLVVELHMMPTGKPESVRFTVGLFFTDEPPVRVPYML
ncbi:MAG TPA: cytochrome c, partial [Vicinamibacterales bacterium]|nr:cytochrome c [Vicinamibacterales bacterium]